MKKIGTIFLAIGLLLGFSCCKAEVDNVELAKIEITTEPAKKEYFVGAAALDLLGMKVTAIYSDNSTKDVTTEVTTSGFDSSAAVESQKITVTYNEKTTTFTVKIIAIELTKIEITTEPAKKEYFVGAAALDLSGMKVTATYNDNSTKDVTTEVTTSGFDSSVAVESKTITVTYGGKSATFTVGIKQGYLFHDAVTSLPLGTKGSDGTSGTYVEFGDWPQDVVPEADVATLGLESSIDKITRGYMEFVQGTDGNYYVKCAENACSDYKYNNEETTVGQDGKTSRWFKVMPIKWRVADNVYDVDGNTGSSTGKLLVAENVLTGNVPYYEDRQNNRTIDGKIVYPNNYMHSQIRAYLNGLSYQGQSEEKTQWNGKGFLQTAFTSTAINAIITTKVDNSEDSTTNYDTEWGTIDKATEYACAPTDDKIFLLSEYEVTKYTKEAFNTVNNNNKEHSRIRAATDFAMANHAAQSIDFGGDWWLRSPYYNSSNYTLIIKRSGLAYSLNSVDDELTGVVPALAISF